MAAEMVVTIPIEDFTGGTLTIGNTHGDVIRGAVGWWTCSHGGLQGGRNGHFDKDCN